MAAVVIYLLFKLVGFVMSILWWAAPVMLIGALIVKPKVVTDYGKWLWNSFRQNAILGIVFTLLTVVAFPIVAGFLLFKSLTYDKWANIASKMPRADVFRTEEAEYEILEEEPLILEEKEPIKRRR